jgi:SAM-dependent methyltransferase
VRRELRSVARRAYDLGARAYLTPLLRREWRHPSWREPNERPLEYDYALRAIVGCAPREILDVGTGTTAWPHLLANCGYRVTAIDESSGYWLRRPFNRHYYVLRDDVTASRLDRHFDLVTCISVLEHIPDHRAAVAGMLGLLRPGGHAVITVPYNEHRFVEDVYRLPGAGYGGDFPFIGRVYSRAEVTAWEDASGASIVDQEYYAVFSGELWTFGERLDPPRRVGVDEPHHLTALLLRKAG